MGTPRARSTLKPSRKDILYAPAVLLIPVLIFYIQFYAPNVVQQAFLIKFPDPSPLAIWGGGYMHPVSDWAIGNIKGLLIVSTLAYLFFASMNEHRAYLKIIVIFAVFAPVLSAITSIIVSEAFFGGPPPGIAPSGSSGIISAVLATLFVGMYTYINRLYGRVRALQVLALALVFAIKGITVSRGLTPPQETNIVLGIIALIIVITLIPLRWKTNTLFNVVMSLKYHHRAILLVPIPLLFITRTANALTPVMNDKFRELVTISIHGTTLLFGLIISVLIVAHLSFRQKR